MVQTVLASVGAALLLLGLVMTGTIAVIQEWVVVTIPPYAACDESPLGKLGLFKATFDPTCTRGPEISDRVAASYADFVKAETATTEFWPLFSSQTGFNGLTTVEFTTCEEFFANDKVFQELGGSPLGEVALAAVEGSFSSGYTTLVTVIGGVVAYIPLVLNDLFSDGIVTVLSSTAAGAAGGGALLDGFFSALAASGPTAGASLVAPMSGTFNAALFELPGTPGAYSQLSMVGAMFQADYNETTAPALVLGFLAAANVPLDDFNSALAAGGLHALIAGGAPGVPLSLQSTVGGQASATTTFTGFLFDGIGALAGDVDGLKDFGFDVVGQILGVAGATAVGDEVTAARQSQVAARILNGCAEAPVNKTFNECNFEALDGSTVLAAEADVCSLARLSPGFASLGLVDGCSMAELLVAISEPTVLQNFDLSALLGDSTPEEVASALIIVANLFPACDAAGKLSTVLATCQNYLLDVSETGVGQDGFPDDFTLPYTLCLTSKAASCDFTTGGGSFIGWANSLIASSDGLRKAAGGLILTCAQPSVALTGDACKNFLKSEVGGGLTGRLVATNFLDADAAGSFVAACEDDEEDARRISLAQVLVPMAIAVEVVALVLAAAAIKMNKTVVMVVAGVLAGTGGTLTLNALLAVRGAPVYEGVGKPSVDDEPLFGAGLASTLGLIAILTPILSGGALLVSACLNRSGSSDAVTAKVEGTY